MVQNAHLEVSFLDAFPFPSPSPAAPTYLPVLRDISRAYRIARLIDRVGEIVIVRRAEPLIEVRVRSKQVSPASPAEIADGFIGGHRRFVLSALRLDKAGFPLPLRVRDQIVTPRDKLYTIVGVQCQARGETELQYWVEVAGDA